jgi:hypothetical protein
VVVLPFANANGRGWISRDCVSPRRLAVGDPCHRVCPPCLSAGRAVRQAGGEGSHPPTWKASNPLHRDFRKYVTTLLPLIGFLRVWEGGGTQFPPPHLQTLGCGGRLCRDRGGSWNAGEDRRHMRHADRAHCYRQRRRASRNDAKSTESFALCCCEPDFFLLLAFEIFVCDFSGRSVEKRFERLYFVSYH